MEKKNVKEFWKEHKVEIIGALSCAAGCVIGVAIAKRSPSESRELIRYLNQFKYNSNTGSTIIGGLIKAQDGSNSVQLFKGNNLALANVGEELIKYYESVGIDLNSKVTGMAVFLDKK